jgi:signal transduction histidine kinase
MFFDLTSTQHPARRRPEDPQLRLREERLEALKLLTDKLAHDFNNILAPLLGYASLIKEEAPPDSLVLQYAEAIEDSARKSALLLDNVLLAARPQRTYCPCWFDLGSLLEQELEVWTAVVTANASVSVHREIEARQIHADREQWRIVIQQLLDNARRALGTGGDLWVSLRLVVLPEAAAAALGLRGTQFHALVFRDTGAGIPAGIQNRVFDPFFTTQEKMRNAGLGLTIVHSVARLNEGQVTIESVEKEGTTVTLWLPVQAPQETG